MFPDILSRLEQFPDNNLIIVSDCNLFFNPELQSQERNLTLKELETCNILKLKEKFGPYNTKVLLNAIHSAVCCFFTDNIKVTQGSNVWKYNNNLFDLTVDRIKLILFFLQ